MKKSLGIASLTALSLLILSNPRPASAQTAGSAAAGSYQFVLDDEVTKLLDFDAATDASGVTSGQMSFTDPTKIPDVDDPEDPRAGDAPPEFYAKATLDSLIVEKNQAVMSGTVVDSSHKTYIGKWVQLVVEDNGDGLEVPDRVTWTFCKPQSGGWVPSDAEWKDDQGAYLRWWATDAERKDDVGIPSKNLLPGEDRGCPVYPLSVYPFASVLKWEGDIVVKP